MRIETERLILAPFTTEDEAGVIAMGADPLSMVFFGGPWAAEASLAAIERWKDRLARQGIGMLAARARDDGRFIGVMGAQWLPYEASFTPAVEIGWRLMRAEWGKGFASEGGRAAMRHVFATGAADHVVAVVAEGNDASARVAERIGMRHALNFEHPMMKPEEPYRLHRLYRREKD